MFCPWSFIVQTMHTGSQNVNPGLMLGGLIFERIFELVYRGYIRGGAYVQDFMVFVDQFLVLWRIVLI